MMDKTLFHLNRVSFSEKNVIPVFRIHFVQNVAKSLLILSHVFCSNLRGNIPSSFSSIGLNLSVGKHMIKFNRIIRVTCRFIRLSTVGSICSY